MTETNTPYSLLHRFYLLPLDIKIDLLFPITVNMIACFIIERTLSKDFGAWIGPGNGEKDMALLQVSKLFADRGQNPIIYALELKKRKLSLQSPSAEDMQRLEDKIQRQLEFSSKDLPLTLKKCFNKPLSELSEDQKGHLYLTFKKPQNRSYRETASKIASYITTALKWIGS